MHSSYRAGAVVAAALVPLFACHSLVGIEDRCTDADCAHLVATEACEKPACTPEGTCSFVARTGESCGGEGTCRGYTCVGADTKLAAGESATCLRASDGLVWCWGQGNFGQLGDSLREPRSTPVLVPRIGVDLPRARSVSVGYAHACALLDDGRVACWGNNQGGQANPRERTFGIDPLGPTVVDGLPKVEEIAAGYGHTCVLTADRRVFCWGKNNEGECGVGDEADFVTTPREVPGLVEILGISTAKLTTCASDGVSVFCWGEAKWGQLGPTFGAPIARAPVKIEGLEGGSVLQVAVSWGQVCALGTSGRMMCWGNDRWGQLGNGVVHTPWGTRGPGEAAFPEPRFVVAPDASEPLPLQGINRIYTGTGSHICVRSSIYYPDHLCWGENGKQEVGVPDTTSSSRPLRSPPTRNATSLLIGNDHTCALRRESDGFGVSCWGLTRAGETGNGQPIADGVQPEPKAVAWPDGFGGIAHIRATQ